MVYDELLRVNCCMKLFILLSVTNAETFTHSSISDVSPKSWFAYIKNYINSTYVKCFDKTGKFTYSFTITCELLLSGTLQRHINKVIISFWTGKQLSQTIVTNPLGQLKRSGQKENQKIDKSEKKEEFYYQYFIWKFYLHHSLGLNITFYDISISFNYLKHCYIGSVHVYSFIKTFNQNIVYCGVYSQIIVYPVYRTIDVIVAMKPYVSYYVKLRYTIIDEGKYLSVNTNKFSSRFVWIFLHKKIYRTRVHCQVEKWKVMTVSLLKLKNLIYKIHDGPDELSDQFTQNNKHIYITSTFQCTLYISSDKFEGLVSFVSKQHEHFAKQFSVEPPSSTSLLYSSLKHKLMSIVYIQTINNYNINITITNFKSMCNCKNNILCTYQGIIFYEVKNETFTAIKSLCLVSSTPYKYRNIYSREPRMLIVMYSYKGHGFVNISMRISATECKLTRENTHLCAYNFVCARKQPSYRDLCKKFIEGSRRGDFDARYSSHNVILHKEKRCTILQFTQKINLFLYKVLMFISQNTLCYILFNPFFREGKFKVNEIRNYQLSGFFTGKLESGISLNYNIKIKMIVASK